MPDHQQVSMQAYFHASAGDHRRARAIGNCGAGKQHVVLGLQLALRICNRIFGLHDCHGFTCSAGTDVSYEYDYTLPLVTESISATCR